MISEIEASGEGSSVYVDFTDVQDAGDAALRIELAYRSSLSGWLARKFGEVSNLLDASLSVGIPLVKANLGAGSSEGMRRFFRLLDMPLQIHQRTGQRCAVIFDEFQDLVRAGSGLEGVLRSRMQHHGNAASCVFAGSHPGMMAAIFGHRERPLYGQARPVVLGPVQTEPLIDYILDRLPGQRVGVVDVVRSLVKLAEGHPQQTMLLAHHLFEQTRSTESVPSSDDVVHEVLAELEEQFALLWASASEQQRSILSALAAATGATDEDAAQLHPLPACQELFATGDLVDFGGRLTLADPLLAQWIVRTGRGASTHALGELGLPARRWEVGDVIDHPASGRGKVIEIDRGEGFGEQRGYLVVNFAGTGRMHLPLTVAARYPATSRGGVLEGQHDIPFVYDQLTVPKAVLEHAPSQWLEQSLDRARRGTRLWGGATLHDRDERTARSLSTPTATRRRRAKRVGD